MTSILSAKHSTARRPATSGDAPALPGQDVTPTPRSGGRVNGGRTVLLVILHYLLKNNITFMGVMCRGNRGGGHSLQSTCLTHVASRPRLEDR